MRVWQTILVCSILTMTTPLVAQQRAGITWQHDLREAHKIAKREGKPLLVVFGAEWCGYCKKLERTTLAQPQLVEYINANFIPVHLDFDQEKKVAKILDVEGLPSTVILSPMADQLGRIDGFVQPSAMYDQLAAANRQWQQSVANTKPPVAAHSASAQPVTARSAGGRGEISASRAVMSRDPQATDSARNRTYAFAPGSPSDPRQISHSQGFPDDRSRHAGELSAPDATVARTTIAPGAKSRPQPDQDRSENPSPRSAHFEGHSTTREVDQPAPSVPAKPQRKSWFPSFRWNRKPTASRK